MEMKERYNYSVSQVVSFNLGEAENISVSDARRLECLGGVMRPM